MHSRAALAASWAKLRRLHLSQLGCLVLQVDPRAWVFQELPRWQQRGPAPPFRALAESLPELNTDFEGLLTTRQMYEASDEQFSSSLGPIEILSHTRNASQAATHLNPCCADLTR